MIDTTATQQRKNLHGAIWAIADDLRGSVDGWDFKSYVLGMMFYRYISENLTNYIKKMNMIRETPLLIIEIFPTRQPKAFAGKW